MTILIVIVLCFFPVEAAAELLGITHGAVSFAPYVGGVRQSEDLHPAYQAEFMANIDLYQAGNVVFSGRVGNMTMISRSNESIFSLDRIRYTVAPGIRYKFKNWLIQGSFYHESYFPISRAGTLGENLWLNSFRIGAGSKGSYYLYLKEEYAIPIRRFIDKWDARIDFCTFFHGEESIWVAKNHQYRHEVSSLIRYFWGTSGNWIFFSGFSQDYWQKSDKHYEHKLSVTLNAFYKGSENFFGIYTTHIISDTFAGNNEDGFTSAGLRVIF